MAERRRHPNAALLAPALAVALLVAGCASKPGRFGGGDGPPRNPPAGLAQVPDAEPREETIRQSGGTSKPYSVRGRSYTPLTDDRAFRESGLASWYGRQFHGQPTASGERYDMYAMTAAHKTLPLPSYVRVRNPANGREAIVRVNDRGPFHDGRIIDLSYTAALQLDLLRGVAPVEIERITNADIRAGTWRRAGETRLAAAPVAPATPVAPAAPESVAVPSAWVTPVADGAARNWNPTPNSPSSSPRSGRVLLAQAAPIAVDRSPGTLSDTTPPPRFGNMPSSELPPLVPAPAPGPEAATAPGAAEPAATPDAAAAALPAAARGFWVQLGAFREAAGAQALQARSADSLRGLGVPLRVFSEHGTHRLQAGPFASRAQADDAALQVRNGLGLAPIVVERR